MSTINHSMFAEENGFAAGSSFRNYGRRRADVFKPLVHGFGHGQDMIPLHVASGMVKSVDDVPCYAAGSGLKKLAAGWLIEGAGIQKGMRKGAFGVSSDGPNRVKVGTPAAAAN